MLFLSEVCVRTLPSAASGSCILRTADTLSPLHAFAQAMTSAWKTPLLNSNLLLHPEPTSPAPPLVLPSLFSYLSPCSQNTVCIALRLHLPRLLCLFYFSVYMSPGSVLLNLLCTRITRDLVQKQIAFSRSRMESESLCF